MYLNNIKKEIWKEYPLPEEFQNNYKMQFSNFGRVRSFTSKNPEGNIINGSLQGGFNIVRISCIKPKSVKDQQKIGAINEQIDQIRSLIKSKILSEEEEQISKENRDALIKKRVKLNTKINKKNRAHFAVLFHRAVAELFLEKPKDKKKIFIIHKDYDKNNNHVENLEWATQEELNERAKNHPKIILAQFKRNFYSEEMPRKISNSKLTEIEVLNIKNRIEKGQTLKKIAKAFGVSDMQIHRIKTGENWSHVKPIKDILNERKLESENK